MEWYWIVTIYLVGAWIIGSAAVIITEDSTTGVAGFVWPILIPLGILAFIIVGPIMLIVSFCEGRK